jgi:hypothetical protein
VVASKSTINKHGPVAQLDRASDFGSEGWGFDSLRGRHPRVSLAAAVLQTAGSIQYARGSTITSPNLRS